MSQNIAVETPESILQYWFGKDLTHASLDPARSKLWWSKNVETDQYIRHRFEPSVLAAASGKLDAWLESPEGRLGLIILTDQFPRNMYRGTPDAFRFDSLACSWCLTAIERQMDRPLVPIQRVFFYLPLEHAESMVEQERSVSLSEDVLASVAEKEKAAFHGFLDFAVRHRDIIRRFGRFPHRNQILKRESSDDERSFLMQPGSSF